LFSLPLSPDELWGSYYQWKSGGTSLAKNDDIAARLYTDIHIIAPMVIYLGYSEKGPKRVNPTNEELQGLPLKKYHWYRCKHLDPKTRDCTIYDIRPAMCRNYPYATLCQYAQCTWKEKRAKKETKSQRKARLKRLQGDIVKEKEKGS
jgi:Fe-S-cluster containining protein